MTNNVIFNKNDYKILSHLLENECFSEIASLSIKQISTFTALSIPKVRLTLKSFLLTGIVNLGAKDGVSNTYYLTEKGIDFINNALGKANNEGDE